MYIHVCVCVYMYMHAYSCIHIVIICHIFTTVGSYMHPDPHTCMFTHRHTWTTHTTQGRRLLESPGLYFVASCDI